MLILTCEQSWFMAAGMSPPVDDLPQFKPIIPVVVVGDELHSSCSNVLRQTEGAEYIFQGPPHEFNHPLHSQSCLLNR